MTMKWVKITERKPSISNKQYHWRGKRCGGYDWYDADSEDYNGFCFGNVPVNHVGEEYLEWLDESESEIWQLELTEKFYYKSGRFTSDYIEISYWYNPVTLQRKETVRKHIEIEGQNNLPNWAKECGYRPHLNQD